MRFSGEPLSAWSASNDSSSSSSSMTPQRSSGALLSPPMSPMTSNTPTPDRFISSRKHLRIEVAHDALSSSSQAQKENYEPDGYSSALSEAMLGPESPILPIAFPMNSPVSPSEKRRKEMEEFSFPSLMRKQIRRPIPSAPERILDAPELMDDYYLNLLDWSSQNSLAIALGNTVYLWKEDTCAIQKLCKLPDENFVTSLSWSFDGSCLAVGTNRAEVQLWDVQRLALVRNMGGHTLRVGAVSWNGHMLSSGSRDTSILHHDVRLATHKVASLLGHSQEVCGLKWSKDGTTLASGGNDNLLNIWDPRRFEVPRHRIDAHTAAVKALAWSPFQGSLLASGGGTADRTIRFWNTSTGACLNTIDTKSQVCALLWGKQRELVSAHGFSQNQITIWQYPSMTKQAELTGHTSRVLHLALSPDGTTVVSAAGDETLRFWRVLKGNSTPIKTPDSIMSAITLR